MKSNHDNPKRLSAGALGRGEWASGEQESGKGGVRGPKIQHLMNFAHVSGGSLLCLQGGVNLMTFPPLF